MDRVTLQEIGKIWDKIGEVERRQSNYTASKVENITPYTESKKAYIGDTETVFEITKRGNLSVFVEDSEGNYPDFTVEHVGDRITVAFEPLENMATITISII